MAEVLEKFPIGRQGRRTWDYAQFFDGRIYRVVGGVDMPSDKNSARNGFYGAAARRGLKVRLYMESHDPLTMVVQALLREH